MSILYKYRTLLLVAAVITTVSAGVVLFANKQNPDSNSLITNPTVQELSQVKKEEPTTNADTLVEETKSQETNKLSGSQQDPTDFPQSTYQFINENKFLRTNINKYVGVLCMDDSQDFEHFVTKYEYINESLKTKLVNYVILNAQNSLGKTTFYDRSFNGIKNVLDNVNEGQFAELNANYIAFGPTCGGNASGIGIVKNINYRNTDSAKLFIQFGTVQFSYPAETSPVYIMLLSQKSTDYSVIIVYRSDLSKQVYAYDILLDQNSLSSCEVNGILPKAGTAEFECVKNVFLTEIDENKLNSITDTIMREFELT